MKQHHKVFIGLTLSVGIGAAIFLLRKRIYKSFDYKTDYLLTTLDPKFRKKVRKLLSAAKKQGIELRVISAHRDCEEQDKLYAKGRTTKGKIVTNASCGKSSHNYKLAVDVVEFINGEPLWDNPRWEVIGRLGEKAGMEWGGRWKSFKDRPHFQDLGGKTIKTLFREYQLTGKLAA